MANIRKMWEVYDERCIWTILFTSFGFGEEFGAAKDSEADTMALYKGHFKGH
jgi:hypothetical protein